MPSSTVLLARHDGSLVTGVSLVVGGDGRPYDFYSRYFSPWNGLPEDPVNGSSHTVLAPYWATEVGEESESPLVAYGVLLSLPPS